MSGVEHLLAALRAAAETDALEDWAPFRVAAEDYLTGRQRLLMAFLIVRTLSPHQAEALSGFVRHAPRLNELHHREDEAQADARSWAAVADDDALKAMLAAVWDQLNAEKQVAFVEWAGRQLDRRKAA